MFGIWRDVVTLIGNTAAVRSGCGISLKTYRLDVPGAVDAYPAKENLACNANWLAGLAPHLACC
ncbi:hypothetical protein JCM19000A_17360 [Silvimonas sp. JCM 19000]